MAFTSKEQRQVTKFEFDIILSKIIDFCGNTFFFQFIVLSIKIKLQSNSFFKDFNTEMLLMMPLSGQLFL